MSQSGIQTRFRKKSDEREGEDRPGGSDPLGKTASDLEQTEAASWSVHLGRVPLLFHKSQGKMLLGTQVGEAA